MCICEINLYPVYSLGLVFALGLQNKLFEDVVVAGNDAEKNVYVSQVSRDSEFPKAGGRNTRRASELSDFGKSLRASNCTAEQCGEKEDEESLSHLTESTSKSLSFFLVRLTRSQWPR